MSEESPCIGICIMEDDVCIGCGRTSEEIYGAGVEAVQKELPRADGFRSALTPVPSKK